MGHQEIINTIKENKRKFIESDVHTTKVMREETELILNKQRTIFHILSVVTLVTVIVTYNI
jgi:hypothetical protein